MCVIDTIYERLYGISSQFKKNQKKLEAWEGLLGTEHILASIPSVLNNMCCCKSLCFV